MALISSVGRFLNAANNKADQLTAGAKAVLCLPSILTNLPKLIINNILSTIGTVLESVVSTVSDLVVSTIDEAVGKITGAITDNINAVTSVLSEIGSVIEQGKEFVDGIKGRIQDVKEFTADKTNCNFAAAELLNCITSQAINSVTPKLAIDISKGLKPINDVANNVANTISKPGGIITDTINKTGKEIDRATQLVEKSNIF